MSDNGPDKRKVNEGRDKPRKTASNPSLRMDFNISRVVGVSGQPENLRLWKGAVVLVTDTDANAIEIFDNLTDVKRR